MCALSEILCANECSLSRSTVFTHVASGMIVMCHYQREEGRKDGRREDNVEKTREAERRRELVLGSEWTATLESMWSLPWQTARWWSERERDACSQISVPLSLLSPAEATAPVTLHVHPSHWHTFITQEKDSDTKTAGKGEQKHVLFLKPAAGFSVLWVQWAM